MNTTLDISLIKYVSFLVCVLFELKWECIKLLILKFAIACHEVIDNNINCIIIIILIIDDIDITYIVTSCIVVINECMHWET